MQKASYFSILSLVPVSQYKVSLVSWANCTWASPFKICLKNHVVCMDNSKRHSKVLKRLRTYYILMVVIVKHFF